ncbi:hypothetical protein M569_01093 [Genlisea aurea]|uniref:Membrane insertase YidC/Oxa/ALB C-terminal domain-containing protein n=1 Tax=Genlisea aurea TaxID=192259 RepID=S8D2N4_9LAMI|nr:hypothetical protein M569_01093 [Genlisea aurea]
MAFRRCIATRAKLLHQHQRVAPSVFPIGLHDNDDDDGGSRVNGISNYFHHRRGNNVDSRQGFGFLSRNRIFGSPMWSMPVRNMSNLSEGSSDKTAILIDAIGDQGYDAAIKAVPLVNEVAIAAADSYFPVAGLMYLIDYVHNYTGFNWWASIVVTTLLIRWIQIPFMISHLKSTSRFMLVRPQLEEVKLEMQRRGMSPAAVAEGQARMDALFKEYDVRWYTPVKGLLVTAPIFCCFFFAIKNMAEKVESFKGGGTLWFTDLTTPDSFYVFPIMTALTFWITVELNAQEGMESGATAGTVKNVSRAFAALTVFFTASFPKAIFCYWITSNLFSLSYGLVMKKPEVKKLLGLPDMPPPPPATATQSFSFFDAVKKYMAAQQQQEASQFSSPPPPPPEEEEPRKASISASSVLRQRIRSLERELKGKNKKVNNNKR